MKAEADLAAIGLVVAALVETHYGKEALAPTLRSFIATTQASAALTPGGAPKSAPILKALQAFLAQMERRDGPSAAGAGGESEWP